VVVRFVLRLLGVLLFAGAFVAVVIDGTRSIAAGRFLPTSLQTAITLFSPDTVGEIETRMTHVGAWNWEPATLWLLAQPAFVVLGIAGLILLLLGHQKARPLGVPRR
jgi:hypothetical protein